jgi:hypothetical protein
VVWELFVLYTRMRVRVRAHAHACTHMRFILPILPSFPRRSKTLYATVACEMREDTKRVRNPPGILPCCIADTEGFEGLVMVL